MGVTLSHRKSVVGCRHLSSPPPLCLHLQHQFRTRICPCLLASATPLGSQGHTRDIIAKLNSGQRSHADWLGARGDPVREGFRRVRGAPDHAAHNGTYILENIDTSALAADKGYEFLFVLGHSKYRGAVQGMINPIAIR